MPKFGSSWTAFNAESRASSNFPFDIDSCADVYKRTTSGDVADKLVIAKICADSDVSSPSAVRTDVTRRVAALRIWSRLDALALTSAKTLPVNVPVAVSATV